MTTIAGPGWPPQHPFPESQRDTLGGNSPDFPGSSGGREQGKFRPSATPLLTTLAVVGDDGTPVGQSVETALTEHLSVLQDIALSLTLLLEGLRVTAIAPGIVLPVAITGLTPTQMQDVPGIGTGAAYATGDAFGSRLILPVPVKGVIQSVTFVDKDNEKLAKDIYVFANDFTATADNAAFAPSDADLLNCVGFISLSGGDFAANSANAVAHRDNIGLAYTAPSGYLYFQFVTRGADNIASGKIPQVQFVIV